MNENLENKISVMLMDKIEKEREENKKTFARKLTETIVFTGVGLVLTTLVVGCIKILLTYIK